MAHHFILLRLDPFGLRVDREGWWFEHSVSQLQVCLSAEGAGNVSWPWLSPLRVWGSLTMAFTGKLVYMYRFSWLNDCVKHEHLSINIKQQLLIRFCFIYIYISFSIAISTQRLCSRVTIVLKINFAQFFPCYLF